MVRIVPLPSSGNIRQTSCPTFKCALSYLASDRRLDGIDPAIQALPLPGTERTLNSSPGKLRLFRSNLCSNETPPQDLTGARYGASAASRIQDDFAGVTKPAHQVQCLV